MSERDENLLKLLEKLSDPNEKLGEDELTSLLTKTYTLCQVPPLQDPNVSYSSTNFEGVAQEAEVNLSILLKFLNYVRLQKSRQSQQYSHMFLKYLIVTCLLAACEYCEGGWEWSSPAAARVSRKIMDQLCELFGCNTVPELLANSSRDLSGKQDCGSKEAPFASVSRSSILKPVLQKLSDELNKDNWRQHPSMKMSYWWILRNIGVSVLCCAKEITYIQ